MSDSPAPTVRADGIGLRYRSGRTGLLPLALRVDPGEVVVALGPNGSGKSSLLRLLSTDLAATEGRLELMGRPARGRQLRRNRLDLGYASDSSVHLPWLTGAENARLFLELKGAVNAETIDRMLGLFEAFALADVMDVPVSEYSFGMGRKLLLLEALAPPHSLVLLDEPTVGLDPDGAAALRRAVRERTERGAAVVIATNDTREVPRWADHVLFLHQGRLVEDAPLSDLLDRIEGRTRIEVEFAGTVPTAGTSGTGSESGASSGPAPHGPARDLSLPGVDSVAWSSTSVHLQSSAGASPLPDLLAFLLARGIEVRDVRVREPDLGDLFRSITGVGIE